MINEEVASSKKVVSLINRLTMIETTAAEAQEVASATEENSAAMQTVTLVRKKAAPWPMISKQWSQSSR